MLDKVGTAMLLMSGMTTDCSAQTELAATAVQLLDWVLLLYMICSQLPGLLGKGAC